MRKGRNHRGADEGRREVVHHLTIKETSNGFELSLDEKRIHNVEEYEITKSSTKQGTAELLVKILVKYP